MLDYNHRPKFFEQVTAVIDEALTAEHASRTPRHYLGASRLGVACERALQYEYAQAPVDPGRELPGRVLRIFEVGHALEALAIRWLRLAGFDLHTEKADGGQFGFSVAGGRIQGHVDGILAGGPETLGLAYPALWECKTMNARAWRETVKRGVSQAKPVYAAQIAVYQAYMEASVPGISQNPALFTAINKDTNSGSSGYRSTADSPSACRTAPCESFRPPRRASSCRASPPRRRTTSARAARGRTVVGVRHDGGQHHLARFQRRAGPTRSP